MKGALLGATAALAAGVVAVGAAALQANERFIQMVEEVDAVGDVTGIAAEKVSVLRFAADVTKTSMGSLTAGLTIYAATASKAAAGNEDAVASFKKLGITQAQLKATQGDTMRLLELTMDGFRGLKNATDQTTASRDLFGRGGTQMLDFLNMGSAGLRKMADEARRLGLIITGEDVTALEQYKAALAVAKSYQEALDIQIGRVTLPLMGAVADHLGRVPADGDESRGDRAQRICGGVLGECRDDARARGAAREGAAGDGHEAAGRRAEEGGPAGVRGSGKCAGGYPATDGRA